MTSKAIPRPDLAGFTERNGNWYAEEIPLTDLAKEFGGTDGHKYVNAVLNQLALQLRATEVEADRKTPTADLPTAATE